MSTQRTRSTTDSRADSGEQGGTMPSGRTAHLSQPGRGNDRPYKTVLVEIKDSIAAKGGLRYASTRTPSRSSLHAPTPGSPSWTHRAAARCAARTSMTGPRRLALRSSVLIAAHDRAVVIVETADRPFGHHVAVGRRRGFATAQLEDRGSAGIDLDSLSGIPQDLGVVD